MFMIEITAIDVESKELHKMEETEEKESKETETKEKKKLKLSTIRIVVISETCLLIIRHKKKVMQVDPLIYLLYFVFLLSKCRLWDRFTRLLHLHEKFAREYVCVRACVCVRVYACVHM